MKRLTRKRIIAAVAILIIAIFAAHRLVLPILLRSQVSSILRAAGLRDVSFRVTRATLWGSALADVKAGQSDSIERVHIDYSVIDLLKGKIDALTLRGVKLALRVSDGKIEAGALNQLFAPSPTTGPTTRAAGGNPLPLDLVRLRDSQLEIVTPTRTVTLPINGELRKTGEALLAIELLVDLGKPLTIAGTVNVASGASDVTIKTDGAAPEKLLDILRAFIPDAPATLAAAISADGKLKWDGESGSASLRLQVDSADDPAATKLSGDKLSVTRGVLQAEASFGPSGASGFVSLDGAEVAWAELMLTSGIARARFDGGTLTLAEMRWNTLGGELAVRDVTIAPGKPINVTIEAKELELKDVLATFAQGKVDGEGKLNGRLPLVISSRRITVGQGILVAEGPGALKVKDVAAIEPSAEAVAKNLGAQVGDQAKRDVIEALKDFQFGKLTAELREEQGKMIGYVRMTGKGRTGAKLPLVYDARIAGLGDLIRFGLSFRQAVRAPGS